MRNHSKLGIFSAGIGLIFCLAVLLVFVGALIPESGTSAEQIYDKFLFIFTFIIAPIFYFAGLTAGIVDAFRKDSKKILPVLGIIINGIALLISVICWILIVVVGIAFLSPAGLWR